MGAAVLKSLCHSRAKRRIPVFFNDLALGFSFSISAIFLGRHAGVEGSGQTGRYINVVAPATRFFPHTASGSGILRFALE